MAMLGMDVAAVRQLAKELEKGSQDITQIQSGLTKRLNAVQWEGKDATAFKADWNSKHVASLRQVVAALHEAAERAEKNASEQEDVSNR